MNRAVVVVFAVVLAVQLGACSDGWSEAGLSFDDDGPEWDFDYTGEPTDESSDDTSKAEGPRKRSNSAPGKLLPQPHLPLEELPMGKESSAEKVSRWLDLHVRPRSQSVGSLHSDSSDTQSVGAVMGKEDDPPKEEVPRKEEAPLTQDRVPIEEGPTAEERRAIREGIFEFNSEKNTQPASPVKEMEPKAPIPVARGTGEASSSIPNTTPPTLSIPPAPVPKAPVGKFPPPFPFPMRGGGVPPPLGNAKKPTASGVKPMTQAQERRMVNKAVKGYEERSDEAQFLDHTSCTELMDQVGWDFSVTAPGEPGEDTRYMDPQPVGWPTHFNDKLKRRLFKSVEAGRNRARSNQEPLPSFLDLESAPEHAATLLNAVRIMIDDLQLDDRDYTRSSLYGDKLKALSDAIFLPNELFAIVYNVHNRLVMCDGQCAESCRGDNSAECWDRCRGEGECKTQLKELELFATHIADIGLPCKSARKDSLRAYLGCKIHSLIRATDNGNGAVLQEINEKAKGQDPYSPGSLAMFIAKQGVVGQKVCRFEPGQPRQNALCDEGRMVLAINMGYMRDALPTLVDIYMTSFGRTSIVRGEAEVKSLCFGAVSHALHRAVREMLYTTLHEFMHIVSSNNNLTGEFGGHGAIEFFVNEGSTEAFTMMAANNIGLLNARNLMHKPDQRDALRKMFILVHPYEYPVRFIADLLQRSDTKEVFALPLARDGTYKTDRQKKSREFRAYVVRNTLARAYFQWAKYHARMLGVVRYKLTEGLDSMELGELNSALQKIQNPGQSYDYHHREDIGAVFRFGFVSEEGLDGVFAPLTETYLEDAHMQRAAYGEGKADRPSEYSQNLLAVLRRELFRTRRKDGHDTRTVGFGPAHTAGDGFDNFRIIRQVVADFLEPEGSSMGEDELERMQDTILADPYKCCEEGCPPVVVTDRFRDEVCGPLKDHEVHLTSEALAGSFDWRRMAARYSYGCEAAKLKGEGECAGSWAMGVAALLGWRVCVATAANEGWYVPSAGDLAVSVLKDSAPASLYVDPEDALAIISKKDNGVRVRPSHCVTTGCDCLPMPGRGEAVSADDVVSVLSNPTVNPATFLRSILGPARARTVIEELEASQAKDEEEPAEVVPKPDARPEDTSGSTDGAPKPPPPPPVLATGGKQNAPPPPPVPVLGIHGAPPAPAFPGPPKPPPPMFNGGPPKPPGFGAPPVLGNTPPEEAQGPDYSEVAEEIHDGFKNEVCKPTWHKPLANQPKCMVAGREVGDIDEVRATHIRVMTGGGPGAARLRRGLHRTLFDKGPVLVTLPCHHYYKDHFPNVLDDIEDGLLFDKYGDMNFVHSTGVTPSVRVNRDKLKVFGISKEMASGEISTHPGRAYVIVGWGTLLLGPQDSKKQKYLGYWLAQDYYGQGELVHFYREIKPDEAKAMPTSMRLTMDFQDALANKCSTASGGCVDLVGAEVARFFSADVDSPLLSNYQTLLRTNNLQVGLPRHHFKDNDSSILSAETKSVSTTERRPVSRTQWMRMQDVDDADELTVSSPRAQSPLLRSRSPSPDLPPLDVLGGRSLRDALAELEANGFGEPAPNSEDSVDDGEIELQGGIRLGDSGSYKEDVGGEPSLRSTRSLPLRSKSRTSTMEPLPENPTGSEGDGRGDEPKLE